MRILAREHRGGDSVYPAVARLKAKFATQQAVEAVEAVLQELTVNAESEVLSDRRQLGSEAVTASAPISLDMQAKPLLSWLPAEPQEELPGLLAASELSQTAGFEQGAFSSGSARPFQSHTLQPEAPDNTTCQVPSEFFSRRLRPTDTHSWAISR